MTRTQLTGITCLVLLFAGCNREAGQVERNDREYTQRISAFIDLARKCDPERTKAAAADLVRLDPDLSMSARQEAMLLLVNGFKETPLEGQDISSDWTVYRNSCILGDAVSRELWRLTCNPDLVIDFWIHQRRLYDAEVSKCEAICRQAEKKTQMQAEEEYRRFNNLKCLYLHSIAMDDESTLMEVVSNKFFTTSRRDFDKSMNDVRKALGRNFGYDEQLRVIHPERK